MKERILNLLNLCMQAKAKGHDCFFDYQAHVNSVEVTSWENGWVSNKLLDRRFKFYINDELYNYDSLMDEAEEYLKGLIK